MDQEQKLFFERSKQLLDAVHMRELHALALERNTKNIYSQNMRDNSKIAYYQQELHKIEKEEQERERKNKDLIKALTALEEFPDLLLKQFKEKRLDKPKSYSATKLPPSTNKKKSSKRHSNKTTESDISSDYAQPKSPPFIPYQSSKASKIFKDSSTQTEFERTCFRCPYCNGLISFTPGSLYLEKSEDIQHIHETLTPAQNELSLEKSFEAVLKEYNMFQNYNTARAQELPSSYKPNSYIRDFYKSALSDNPESAIQFCESKLYETPNAVYFGSDYLDQSKDSKFADESLDPTSSPLKPFDNKRLEDELEYFKIGKHITDRKNSFDDLIHSKAKSFSSDFELKDSVAKNQNKQPVLASSHQRRESKDYLQQATERGMRIDNNRSQSMSRDKSIEKNISDRNSHVVNTNSKTDRVPLGTDLSSVLNLQDISSETTKTDEFVMKPVSIDENEQSLNINKTLDEGARLNAINDMDALSINISNNDEKSLENAPSIASSNDEKPAHESESEHGHSVNIHVLQKSPAQSLENEDITNSENDAEQHQDATNSQSHVASAVIDEMAISNEDISNRGLEKTLAINTMKEIKELTSNSVKSGGEEAEEESQSKSQANKPTSAFNTSVITAGNQTDVEDDSFFEEEVPVTETPGYHLLGQLFGKAQQKKSPEDTDSDSDDIEGKLSSALHTQNLKQRSASISSVLSAKTEHQSSVDVSKSAGNSLASPKHTPPTTTQRTSSSQPLSAKASAAKKVMNIVKEPDTEIDLQAILQKSKQADEDDDEFDF